MKEQAPLGWAGIDVGKGHHWICLIDPSGATVWSAKVVNDEAAILDAVGGVLARAEEVVWGVDVTGTMSGLLLALLAAHGQRVRYVPGRTVNQMASAYRGEAKTDARDAYVIAETLRHRGDLAEVELATSLVSELRLLVTHRSDLVGDRVRMVNRLRDVLSDYFPALERSFDYAHSRGALLLLTGYQTPQAIRRGSATLGCGRGWSSGRSAALTRSQRPRWLRARHSRPSCPGKTWRPASWPTSPPSSWRSVRGSPSWTPGSPPRSARTRRPRSSSPCQQATGPTAPTTPDVKSPST